MHLGRYEVLKKIGGGGFGEVLLARAIGAEGFERIVALKRLKGDLARQHLKGIINEARIGGLLSHPNIVQVLEFIRLEDRDKGDPEYLLVMEYVDGLPLQEILELNRGEEKLITPALAIDIALQVCEGLHYAHAARSVNGLPLRLIHRDIKPSNLMVTRNGTVKIMDFGVAKASSNMGHSSTGSIKGTLRYLSPEQAEGSEDIGHESDLFSLGLVLCELVTGHSVYEADHEHLVLLRALQGQTGSALKAVEALAPGLGPILTRCMSQEPDDRYRTAEELAQALRDLKSHYPSERSLASMMEKAMVLLAANRQEDGFNLETSFSLELRKRELDEVQAGWELLPGGLELGDRERKAEPPPMGRSSMESPMGRSSMESPMGRSRMESPPRGPSTRGQLQGPPQKRPPVKGATGNSWEWEWKLTDSLNNIQVTPELENQAIQAAENAVARMTRTDDGLETLVPGPSMVPSEGGDGVVRPSGAYGVTPSPEPESLWGKASSTEATSSHPVAANSRRDQTPPGENTRLTHHQETPQGPLRTDRDGQTSSAGVVQEGRPEFGGSERGRDTDGQETVPVSPSSEQQSRVVTPHRPTGPHRAHREGVMRFGVGILLGLLLFALGFALGMLYLKSQRSEADAQSAALIEEDAGRLTPTAMDGAQ